MRWVAEPQFDHAFERLDELIARTAKAIPGYLGAEAWENSSTGLVSNTYYGSSMEALETRIRYQAHLEAKSRQAQGLAGCQVIIAQVPRSQGDAQIDDPLTGLAMPRTL